MLVVYKHGHPSSLISLHCAVWVTKDQKYFPADYLPVAEAIMPLCWFVIAEKEIFKPQIADIEDLT